MKLEEIAVIESIEDKGIFKACFVLGTPGAGKSYTISKITDGNLQPRIVNTDKYLEFLANKRNIDLSTKANQKAILDDAMNLSKQALENYINGVLPLFVDSTSSNADAVLRRMGILESVGYDISIVWVQTDLETALQRARERSRKVDEDFIKRSFEVAEENVNYLKGKASQFFTVDNNDGQLTNNAILSAYRKTSNFFNSPIQNPVGKRYKEEMKENGWKYLTPNIYSEGQLNSLVSSWYKRN
mgnify:CR=1 FL=1